MNRNARAALALRRLPIVTVLLLASSCHAPPVDGTSRRDARVAVRESAAAPTPENRESCGRELELVPSPSEEDRRLPRPSSWTRIVARSYEDKATVAVFEAETPLSAARTELVGNLEAAGYRVGPIIADDTRGFARGDVRVVAVFAPIDVSRSRVSVAVLAVR